MGWKQVDSRPDNYHICNEVFNEEGRSGIKMEGFNVRKEVLN